jgi:hypothetical protein
MFHPNLAGSKAGFDTVIRVFSGILRIGCDHGSLAKLNYVSMQVAPGKFYLCWLLRTRLSAKS